MADRLVIAVFGKRHAELLRPAKGHAAGTPTPASTDPRGLMRGFCTWCSDVAFAVGNFGGRLVSRGGGK
jgi:hypothetical protein